MNPDFLSDSTQAFLTITLGEYLFDQWQGDWYKAIREYSSMLNAPEARDVQRGIHALRHAGAAARRQVMLSVAAIDFASFEGGHDAYLEKAAHVLHNRLRVLRRLASEVHVNSTKDFLLEFFALKESDVRFELDDACSMDLRLARSGGIEFTVVVSLSERGRMVRASSKLVLLSLKKGLIRRGPIDDGGTPLPAGALARILQLRKAETDMIGSLAPLPLTELVLPAGAPFGAGQQDALAVFALDGLVAASLLMRQLPSLGTLADVLEYVKSGVSGGWVGPELYLSGAMESLLADGSSVLSSDR